VAWVAGEVSGDQIAAGAVERLGAESNVVQRGVGGPAMRGAGLQCDAGIEQLSVRGYVEVIRHLPRLLGLRARLAELYTRWPADCFVGVDAPDFNLALERRIRARGIPTVHMVGPSIWAWRAKRKHAIASCADHLLLLFPFEPPLYADTGIQTHFVGHPMADEIEFDPDPAAARRALGITRERAFSMHYDGWVSVDAFEEDARWVRGGHRSVVDQTMLDKQRVDHDQAVLGEQQADHDRGALGRWICLLPGSRPDEILQHGPLMIDVAQQIARRHPHSTFLIPAASPTLHRMLAQQVVAGVREAADRIFLVSGDARTCIAASDQVLAASGTACLEAALLGRPMVVIYRMPAASYAWMKRQQLQPWVGLPNILAGRFLVPELIQGAAKTGPVVEALEGQWRDHDLRHRLKEEFLQMHRALRQDCARQTAAVIRKVLGV
jgi:lipid-A-disaccharide synthase